MRILMLCGAVALLSSGCHMMPSMADMETMMAKPEQPAEMKMLEKMIGTWEMTGEMVSSPPEMTAMMTDESGEAPEKMTMKAQSTMSWCLDGMFAKSVGAHEMPDGGEMQFEEYVTWDAGAGKFRTAWFSNWGETGHGWMSFADDGMSCTVQGRGMTVHGTKKSYSGAFNFVDPNTMKWTFTEHTPMGPMTMEGMSKKKM